MEHPTRPYEDQRPGTAGLRRKVAVFRQPQYLDNFVQSVFDAGAMAGGDLLVVGGDGRHFNDEAVRVVLAVAAGNGVRRVLVGRNGWLSTPAASHLIRTHAAAGGFLLTASHNPGGPDGDFGIKFNVANGGQAPEALTERVYAVSRKLTRVRSVALPQLDLSRTGVHDLAGMRIEVIDPVEDYAALMETLFDFDAIRDLLTGGAFRMRYDAMNAITGPYATEIIERRLGAPAGSVVRAEPLPDFGGGHPDPNPVDAAELCATMAGEDAPDFAAASDGDGDRNMILGRGCLVHPCDSLAILAARHRLLPGYRNGLAGVARSMPTSRAVDVVAERLGIPCYVTPTGWRFFCNLLDSGRVSLCGEESFGTSSDHVREKDGLWAVLAWLNLLAVSRTPVDRIVAEHWTEFGRHVYQREDYFIADAGRARALMDALEARAKAPPPAGVASLASFCYEDPVDGSVSAGQGVEAMLADGCRVVFRLSGTGTTGATLRVYLERPVSGDDVRLDTTAALAELSARAAALAGIREHTGLEAPTHRI